MVLLNIGPFKRRTLLLFKTKYKRAYWKEVLAGDFGMSYVPLLN